MALKLSKRKYPKREEKQYKEKRIIESEVFDRETLLTVGKFIADGIIKSLDFPIYEGKESVIFRATAGEKSPLQPFLAVKIYKIETTGFKNMQRYIIGDRRFEGVRLGSKHQIISIWAKKEFKNLNLAKEAGVDVPRTLKVRDNVLIMEYIGDENAAPKLKDIVLLDPLSVYKQIMDNVKKLNKVNLVHSDLSEYNILIVEEKGKEKPVFIDMGQAVLYTHPHAEEFYERDIANIKKYFAKKYGLVV